MTMRNPGHCSQSRTYPPLAHRAATVRGTWLRGQGADKSGCGYNGTLRKLRWACPLDFGAKTLLAVTTGLRRGEILGLRWQDVNLDRGILSVVQTLEQTREGLRFKPPKTKRSRRVVTLPTVTIEALRHHRAEQARIRLQLGMGRDEEGLVCAKYDGQPRSPRNFTKEFTRLISRLDIPHITFHGLRHSHATQLLGAGIHPKIAQERLGHSTIATTMDLYSHVTESMQEDAAARIDDALRAAIGKHKGNKS